MKKLLLTFFLLVNFAFASEAQVLSGQSVTISVTADGLQPFTYQWKKDGVDIPGATAEAYAIAKVGPEHAGNYTVQVSNKAGFVLSDNAAVTIVVKPSNAVTSITNKSGPAIGSPR